MTLSILIIKRPRLSERINLEARNPFTGERNLLDTCLGRLSFEAPSTHTISPQRYVHPFPQLSRFNWTIMPRKTSSSFTAPNMNNIPSAVLQRFAMQHAAPAFFSVSSRWGARSLNGTDARRRTRPEIICINSDDDLLQVISFCVWRWSWKEKLSCIQIARKEENKSRWDFDS